MRHPWQRPLPAPALTGGHLLQAQETGPIPAVKVAKEPRKPIPESVAGVSPASTLHSTAAAAGLSLCLELWQQFNELKGSMTFLTAMPLEPFQGHCRAHTH